MENGRRFEQAPTTSTRIGHERPNSTSLFTDDPFDLQEGQRLFPFSKRLGDVGEAKENQIPIGVAAEDSTTNDSIRLERVPMSRRQHL
ncbi:unnamed protein product [Rodentolepis nana]|uniref:Uncharacterized protein n=1 Tax=Rodentolepis nana TaxID=102285 RepID=A0A0R3TUS0_RODNA|nr:unnamed protein product [Rodentolepis nana]